MDYKETLNLPKTAFPMKASLAQREPKRLAQWEASGLYQKIRQQCADRDVYIMHDGPPYANAPIHLGTSLNKILKDIVTKSKTLSGFNVPFVPGWDCHGLPIELKVEKKVGKPGTKLDHRAFRQACREFAAKQVDIQKADFKRLGILGEWDNPYLSMQFSYEANEIRALASIIEKGHLERGQKPVHWCTACASALAEAEVDYKDKKSPAIDVAFDVVDVTQVAKHFGSDVTESVAMPIWTTTPWTLPSNKAVAVNPHYDYVLVQCDHDGAQRTLILAKSLVDDVMRRYGISDYEVLGEAKGEVLEGLQLHHPFLEHHSPVVLGDHVTADAGTGNVHTAPAHGLDDYAMGLKYNLSQECPVDSRSCFVGGTPLVAGLHVFKANQPIIDALHESGHLLYHEEIEHSYPHCWRHKTPLIFRATPQWFISMQRNGLRDQAMAAVEQTRWLPDWGKKRIVSMMESRPDWCISRQRTWGVPITLFVHNETNELHPQTATLMLKIADIVEKEGIDAWHDVDAASLIGEDAKEYYKVTDTLDVWFDSGVTHYCVLDQRKELHTPADLYLEGSDQHRGWFQTSLLTSVAMRGEAPFKTVLTHGYVVDAKGHKMSKSVGNTIAPKDIVNKLGADVLRLWVASSDFTGDIKVSDEIFKRCSDAYRRIRNTARFLLSNLNDFDPTTDLLDMSELVALDHWVIATTKQLQEKIIEAYENFQFQTIYQLLHNFCAVELGSFYLDVVKDRLYTVKGDAKARRSAQTAMYHILEAMVRWLAPILSFTADEIWECMPGEHEASAIFYDRWYTGLDAVQANTDLDWPLLMQVRDAVNKQLESARQAGHIGSALDAEVTLYAGKQLHQQLSALEDELRFVLITSGATVLPLSDATAEAQATGIDELRVVVTVSADKKCERCWQRSDTIGSNQQHPTLCGRCIVNISQQGESRRFA